MKISTLKYVFAAGVSTLGFLSFAFVSHAAILSTSALLDTGLNTGVNSASSSVQVSNDAATVTTSGQVDTFAHVLTSSDADFKSYASNADSVSVDYSQKARFLGIFPSSVNTHVTVGADGKVKVSYPWYSFLLLKSKSGLETKINSDTRPMFSSNSNASANAQLSAQNQARIISIIHSDLK